MYNFHCNCSIVRKILNWRQKKKKGLGEIYMLFVCNLMDISWK